MVMIIGLSISFQRNDIVRIAVVFALDAFKIEMIGPVVVAIETNDQEVAVCVICQAEDIFVHRSNDALNRSGALARRSRLLSGPVHHDETDWLSVISRPCYIIVCWPFARNVLTIIS